MKGLTFADIRRKLAVRRRARRAFAEARRVCTGWTIKARAAVHALDRGSSSVRRMEEPELLAKVSESISGGKVTAAYLLAEAGARRYPKSRDLLDIRAGAAAYMGQHRKALQLCISGANEHLAHLAAIRPHRPSQVLTREQRIFLSGYFYSGSGAVLDWLRGYENTTKWSPAGEMRLIKFPGGLADLAKRYSRRGTLRDSDLVDLYLHITGSRVVLTPPGVYDKWRVVNDNSQKLRARSECAGYLQVCFQNFLSIVEARDSGALSAHELDERFRRWVQGALDAVATDTKADLVLVDQAVTAWRMPIARFVPPSCFIVVHRDPRDQFAEVQEILKHPGRNQMTAAEFAADYRKNRELVDGCIPELTSTYGHRFIRVSFEDFVLDHARQAELLQQWLGIHGRQVREVRFRPELSAANIGKHRRLISPEDAAILADALPEYLHPRVSEAEGEIAVHG